MKRYKIDEDVSSLLNSTGVPDGLKEIGAGGNRVVYRITNSKYGSGIEGHVLKIDSVENEMEVNAWEYSQDKYYNDYLVPVISRADDYSWILMPYGESVPEGLVDEELYEELCDLASDISKNDFVYIDNVQKCCDYASIASTIL